MFIQRLRTYERCQAGLGLKNICCEPSENTGED